MDNPDQATRREAWDKILSEQEASGLSQAALCKKHNLPLPRFSYYRSALRGSRKKSRPSTPEFEPVKLKSVPESVMPSSDIQLCDAGHGAKLGGESPLWADLKRSTSLGKGTPVKECHEGS